MTNLTYFIIYCTTKYCLIEWFESPLLSLGNETVVKALYELKVCRGYINYIDIYKKWIAQYPQ